MNRFVLLRWGWVLFFISFADQNGARDDCSSPTRRISQYPEYGNERFRDVQVYPSGHGIYEVTGEVQVFEAVFAWEVRSRGDTLLHGVVQAEKGAPDWGAFSFRFRMSFGQRGNKTLFLFINSAKDGGRKYILSIPLGQG